MTSGRSPRSRVDPARRAAYDILHRVGAEDGYANLVARQVLDERQLDARDAAFATELSMGTLRRRGTLDAVLALSVDRPLPKVDPRLLDVLRLGSYQLLFLGTAPHAAVNSSVELARSVCGTGPDRMANAVLRKVSARDRDQWLTRIEDGLDNPIAKLAVTYSHPEWIVRALRDALGPRRDELPALLDADNQQPGVTLVARPGRLTRTELLEQTGGSVGLWSPWAVHLPSGKPGNLDAVRSGRAGVQDEGSQVVALAFAGSPVEGRDERWLDLCAGPGGKTALLSGLQADGELLAVEPIPARARLVAQALRGAPGHAGVIRADGRHGPWRQATFDRVLVDAPCTGLGALRRRPEARWRRVPGDLPRLTRLQGELLDAALAAVRPGGIVGYATCSPHIAETDLVVDRVLNDRDDVVELDAHHGLPGLDDAGAGRRMRLWPHRHGTDGMFLAVLQRR